MSWRIWPATLIEVKAHTVETDKELPFFFIFILKNKFKKSSDNTKHPLSSDVFGPQGDRWLLYDNESDETVAENCYGQSHTTVSINHNFWRERKAEADSNRGPSAYQPAYNARPNRLTYIRSLGSQGFCQKVLPPCLSCLWSMKYISHPGGAGVYAQSVFCCTSM